MTLSGGSVGASARADTVAEALALVAENRLKLRDANLARSHAEDQLHRSIIAAGNAGASVRRTAAAAGVGRTMAHNIMRYGEPGWS